MNKEQLKLKGFCIDLRKNHTMKIRFDQCIERLKTRFKNVSDNDFFINCNDEIVELCRNYRYYINGGFAVSLSERQTMCINLSNYVKSLCQTTSEK